MVSDNERNTPLGDLRLSSESMPEQDFLRQAAERLAMEYRETLTDTHGSLEFASRVSAHFARSKLVIGLGKVNGVMTVATSQPLDTAVFDDLADLLDVPLDMILAPSNEILRVISETYQKDTTAVTRVLDELEDTNIDGIARELEKITDLMDMATSAPVIKLMNHILLQAIQLRASDIHIQPYEQRLVIRFRIDGVLYDRMTPPKKIQDALISRVKVMAEMDIAERRLPQDGGTSVLIGDREVDMRISSVPTSFGERIVIRLQDKSADIYSIDKIGLSQGDLAMLSRYIRYTHGILLVTGPTGSGKTTTLYSMLKEINSPEKNIITVEDPIEYLLPGISQIQVSDKKGLTFARGLRSIVRQDPDIIMVGEIRDLETARIAIQASLTGHLVLSTLHTNDSAGAVTRLLDLGVEPYLAASSLIGVVAQRLVRLVCPHCRRPVEAPREELQELDIDAAQSGNVQFYTGAGCDECMNTGFKGRTGIYEVLPIGEEVKNQIVDHASATEIKKAAMQRGLVTLRMEGRQKVLDGLTTADEVIRVTQREAFLL